MFRISWIIWFQLLNGENMKYWILEILNIFAIPAILILAVIVTLLSLIDINIQETSNVVLGVMLGVHLDSQQT